jgi:hypothetical protein
MLHPGISLENMGISSTGKPDSLALFPQLTFARVAAEKGHMIMRHIAVRSAAQDHMGNSIK